MKEYYRLLGIECSKRLRTKLDCALKICSNPSKESFAQVATDWNGICLLHRRDGLCELQTELGEYSLPEVCRLYPRNVKSLPQGCECSCSNSCEAVVELLANQKEPLLFEEVFLPFEPEFTINLTSLQLELCKKSLLLMQDRTMPLPERFLNLGNKLYGTDLNFQQPDNLFSAFQLLHSMEQYFEDSISVQDCCKEAQKYFCIENKEELSTEDLNTISIKYLAASEHLNTVLPDWQILFEQLIVNHMFYDNFPYTNNYVKVNDSFLSLVLMYSFLRFNVLGCMSCKADKKDLIEILAAMFRLIEHSNFSETCIQLYKKNNYPIQECIPQLLHL
jgi:hypothetical protein